MVETGSLPMYSAKVSVYKPKTTNTQCIYIDKKEEHMMKLKQQKVIRQEIRLKHHVLSAAVRRGLGLGGAAVMLSMSALVLSNSTFGPVVELSDLDGRNGFANKSINIRSAKARVYKSQKRSAIESTKRRHRG